MVSRIRSFDKSAYFHDLGREAFPPYLEADFCWEEGEIFELLSHFDFARWDRISLGDQRACKRKL